MLYLSTRGGEERLSFEDAVLRGLAPNGGLYIPESIPALPSDWESKWAQLSFEELAFEVYSLFVPKTEVPSEDLKALIAKSYASFRHENVTPIHHLRDNTYILELFHGPTFAFKDVALQFLGNLFEYFLVRKNKSLQPGEKPHRLTVIGATSGDTGGAAIYGLKSRQNVNIFILYPKGRVSPIQEAQMTSVPDANVRNIAVEGSFDDCQDIVKTLFGDKAFNDEYTLGAVNSINWARILAQIVYYFHAYFQLKKATGNTPQFVVPTGNFGDILAGYYAKRLGLPMAKLVAATNENDILARFWASGVYEKDASVGVKATLAPAMDILVSSNFERLLLYLALEHTHDVAKAQALLASWMDELKTTGRFAVPQDSFDAARRDFVADRVSDPETKQTINKVFADKHYVLDPHTAIGVTVAERLAPSLAPGVSLVALATAHPAKFDEAVSSALKDHPAFDFSRDVLPPQFHGLLDLPRRITDAPASSEAVKKIIKDALA